MCTRRGPVSETTRDIPTPAPRGRTLRPTDRAGRAPRTAHRRLEPPTAMDFLRENWLYIVLPIALVLLGLVALVVFGDDSASNFIYNIF